MQQGWLFGICFTKISFLDQKSLRQSGLIIVFGSHWPHCRSVSEPLHLFKFPKLISGISGCKMILVSRAFGKLSPAFTDSTSVVKAYRYVPHLLFHSSPSSVSVIKPDRLPAGWITQILSWVLKAASLIRNICLFISLRILVYTSVYQVIWSSLTLSSSSVCVKTAEEGSNGL